jgi:hypothetical protein
MPVRLLVLSALYWMRTIIFWPSQMKALEKRLVDYRNARRLPNIDRYLDVFEGLLEQLHRAKSRRIGEQVFLEIGSGQNLVLPVLLKLAGAKAVITIDVEDIVAFSLAKTSLRMALENERFSAILRRYSIRPQVDASRIISATCLRDFLLLSGVTYISDGDLSRGEIFVKYELNQADFVYSNNVLEHIPEGALKIILSHCRTHLRAETLHLHYVDLSDHFSHAASKISSINFLRYSKLTWEIIAGNRYIYQNRLRYSDIDTIFKLFFAYVESMRLEALPHSDASSALKNVHKTFIKNGIDIGVLRMRIVASNVQHFPSAGNPG